MKNLYSHITEVLKRLSSNNYILNDLAKSSYANSEILEAYKIDLEKIQIENQSFLLSGLLHILTNKISHQLKNQKHTLHYEIDKDIPRSIVGDNIHIEQVLEPILHYLIQLTTESEIILHIRKESGFLHFDLYNMQGSLPKTLCKGYELEKISRSVMDYETFNAFIKAKHIANAMGGSLTFKCSMWDGAHFLFKLPYIHNSGTRDYRLELQKAFQGKKVLYIEKSERASTQICNIFTLFGLTVEKIKPKEVNKKIPYFENYLMIVLHASHLSPSFINFFRIVKKRENMAKLIIVHDLFEKMQKIEMADSIISADLYSPIILGDVEDVLYQTFILKQKPISAINKVQEFDTDAFVITENPIEHFNKEKFLKRYQCAHIAIVDDNTIVHKLMHHILYIQGITFYMLHNGQELIDLIEKEKIDIVFTDISMPVMDGITATRKIRNELGKKSLPIISISSMAFEHELLKMHDAGMTAAVPKPISAQRLYLAMDRYLEITPAMQARCAKATQKGKIISWYQGHTAILDIEKGIEEAGSPEQYLQLLDKTMKALESSQDVFNRLISEKKYHELKNFTHTLLRLYTHIYASEMIDMFNEVLMYISTYNNNMYLSEYISIYDKNYRRLQKEIESFKTYLKEGS